MIHKTSFTSVARKDLLESFNWYEKKQPGLGRNVLLAIEDIVKQIARSPDAFPLHNKFLRTVPVKRFPFVVIYKFTEAEVVIHAVFNTSRDPKRKP